MCWQEVDGGVEAGEGGGGKGIYCDGTTWQFQPLLERFIRTCSFFKIDYLETVIQGEPGYMGLFQLFLLKVNQPCSF